MQKLINLTLHTGGSVATMDEVRNVVTPQPTETWCPIGHHELVDSVVGTLAGSGLKVVHEAHALWHGGDRYFGAMQLVNGEAHDDYALVIGVRNSHDKTFPSGFACGSGVFVCDNLAFSGEVTLARRHTARIRQDLPRLIQTAVGRLGAMKQNQDTRIACYKATNLSDAQAHDLVIRSVDCGALPVTRIPLVLEQWRKPKHEEFGPRTAWSLFNGFTEIYKQGNAITTLQRSLPLNGLFDQFAGLKVMASIEEADAVINGGAAILAHQPA